MTGDRPMTRTGFQVANILTHLRKAIHSLHSSPKSVVRWRGFVRKGFCGTLPHNPNRIARFSWLAGERVT